METKGLYVRLNEAGNAVEILDQTALPVREKWLSLSGEDELCEAITSLRVRGAPAIGIFAAYALYVMTVRRNAPDYKSFLVSFKEHCTRLLATRPTAVNLKHAILACVFAVQKANPQTVKVSADAIRLTAERLQTEDAENCRKMAEHALTLLKQGDTLLTHCNAGPLATSRYGTALGPMILGQEKGYRFSVYCDETRPLMQGARLTAFELRRAGVKYTLIPDSAAFDVLKHKNVAAVFVGCDRMAQNGDFANKIGTSALAVLAREAGVPFYVCCPNLTIDRTLPTGDDIPIEVRDAREVTELYFAEPVAPAGTDVYNPAFDVTEANYITAVITEDGVFYPPFDFSEN